MSQQVVFIRAFAELVWLLVYRPNGTADQKEALRSALLEGRDERFALSLVELNRAIASAIELTPVPSEMPYLNELSARMAAHSVGLLDFSAGSKAGDVLGVARVLASAAVQGDEGANFDRRLASLQLTTVAVRMGRAGFVRRPTPLARTREEVAPTRRTPGLGIQAIEGPPSAPRAVIARELGIGAPTPVPAMWRIRADGPADHAGISEQDRMVEAAFSRQGHAGDLGDLLRRLEGELSKDSAPAVLDDLSRTAEDAAREGRWEVVSELLHRMIGRESMPTDGDVKRTFLIHLRRLFKPGVLRGVAQLLAKRRDLREQVEGIFVRTGEAGAEVLLDLLVTSNLATERRAYRSAVARCPAAANPLMHLLGDQRWYVVRNAAELLGEMSVPDAELKLVATLRHSDARVRRSAAAALSRLGSTRGIFALQPLVRDSNPGVRLQAIHGIAAARMPRSVPALLQGLEREDDAEVQHALLTALGAHPTDESVDRLTQAAQPGSLLHRKATPYRLAAVQALGEAGTHAAMAALRGMQGDRDREVRATIDRVLSAHAQGAPVARSS